jgi:hypothetical protein
MPSETDIFMTLFHLFVGSVIVGVFSQSMRLLAWGSKYACATGDNTCKFFRDAAVKGKIFFSDILGVKDLEKGVGSSLQVVVLVACLIVLIGILRVANLQAPTK